MKHLLLFVSFSLIFSFSKAQYSQYLPDAGARQGGMAGSGVTISDIWSSYHNQAGLADLKGISAGLFYSNIYNVSAFKETAFAVAAPIEKYGSVGLNYSYSGDFYSNFSKFGLAFSKRLGKRITGGIQIDYIRFMQLDYGTDGVAVGELGIIAEPVENLFIAAHVFNPWMSKFPNSGETISSIFRLGGAYNFSEKVLLTIEGEKDVSKPLVFRGATEYNVAGGLFLRVGVATKPTKYSFGVGYNFKGASLDLAYISHDVLGHYIQFGLGYTLAKK